MPLVVSSVNGKPNTLISNSGMGKRLRKSGKRSFMGTGKPYPNSRCDQRPRVLVVTEREHGQLQQQGIPQTAEVDCALSSPKAL